MVLAKSEQAISCTTSNQLAIDADGGIRSSRFNDIYFNAGLGLEESRYVFLEGNQLKGRWEALFKQKTQRNDFIIAETGFGTGLNFLAAVDLWLTCAKQASHKQLTSNPTLYYYSTERFPLTPKALNKIYAAYNPLPKLSQKLQACYPDPISSDYLLEFEFSGLRIKLILLFGDSCDALERFESYPSSCLNDDSLNPNLIVDAWFLDGFAPPVNPDMWTQQLFSHIKVHSSINTTLATFTVARTVKDQLLSHNFQLEKRSGFGKKREMLMATFTQPPLAKNTVTKPPMHSPTRSKYDTLSPCYFRYSEAQSINSNKPKALIIGAGIAGASTAFQLAKEGWHVLITDSQHSPASAASGNNVGVLYARTANQRSMLSDFHESAFHYAVNFYASLSGNNLSSGLSGMIKLNEELSLSFLNNNSELKSRKNIDQQQAQALSGLTFNNGGVLYSDAGWINPSAICSALLNENNIHFLPNSTVSSLNKVNQQWEVVFTNGTALITDAVIIACGEKSHHFEQSHWLPLKAIRGQTTELNIQQQSNLTNLLEPLKITVCDKGYITPTQQGVSNLGASFTINSSSPNTEIKDHTNNLSNLANCFNKNTALHKEITLMLNNQQQLNALTGRVGFRAVSPDYLPMVGPLAKQQQFNVKFSDLQKNAKQTINYTAPLESGLFVIAGFGSHGFTTAPLAAAILTAQITQKPIPFGDKLRQAISPNRFLIRQLIRGK